MGILKNKGLAIFATEGIIDITIYLSRGFQLTILNDINGGFV